MLEHCALLEIQYDTSVVNLTQTSCVRPHNLLRTPAAQRTRGVYVLYKKFTRRSEATDEEANSENKNNINCATDNIH